MFAVGDKPPGIGSVVGEANVVRFPVSDDFKDIAPKVRAALAWGLEHDYSSFFVMDDDTYLIPGRLYPVPDEEPFDYLGWYRPNGGAGFDLPYIQGSAYLLSQKAAEFVVAAQETMKNGTPDDVAVGRALHGKVDFTHDSRFHPGPVPELAPHRITTHKALPLDMRRIHAQYLSGRYAA